MSKMTDKEINCEKCFHKDVCEKRTCAECGGLCDECEIYHQYDGKPNILNCEDFADADIINRQQAEIERLRTIAKKMHSWIFTNSYDEEKAYAECGLTDEENTLLGYCGKIVFESKEMVGEVSEFCNDTCEKPEI